MTGNGEVIQICGFITDNTVVRERLNEEKRRVSRIKLQLKAKSNDGKDPKVKEINHDESRLRFYTVVRVKNNNAYINDKGL